MRKLLFFMMLLASMQLFAQNQPPVSAEIILGAERTSFQISMNKPIAGDFRYMNITTGIGYYDLNKGRTELTMINSIIYQFHPNVGISGGLDYHYVSGIVPSAAAHFSYADPVWRFQIIPFLNLRPDVNSENVFVAEYKPQINDKFRLYTHIMGLYNHNLTLNQHDRSFYKFRLGLIYRNFTFGAGSNLDYYGPARRNINIFGGFLKIDV